MHARLGIINVKYNEKLKIAVYVNFNKIYFTAYASIHASYIFLILYSSFLLGNDIYHRHILKSEIIY